VGGNTKGKVINASITPFPTKRFHAKERAINKPKTSKIVTEINDKHNDKKKADHSINTQGNE
jgi:hypothetical protein